MQADHPQTPASGGERRVADTSNVVKRIKANWYKKFEKKEWDAKSGMHYIVYFTG